MAIKRQKTEKRIERTKWENNGQKQNECKRIVKKSEQTNEKKKTNLKIKLNRKRDRHRATSSPFS